MAVAVWDRVPTPDELLKARLEKGWQPRPSLLKEGDVVVGHAACVVVKAVDRDSGNLHSEYIKHL
jgi:hypothetical protein